MFSSFRAMWLEKDGQTLCFVRLATLLGQVAYFAMTALAIKHGQQIDFSVWSIGYSALILGGAGGVLLKLKSEG